MRVIQTKGKAFLVALVGLPLLGYLFSVPARAEMFGQGYRPCGEVSTTPGIVDCIGRKTRNWDARLNDSYRTLLRTVDGPKHAALQAAQRSWLQYRDANCAFYAVGPGTISEVNVAECLRAMTEDRARELGQALTP